MMNYDNTNGNQPGYHEFLHFVHNTIWFETHCILKIRFQKKLGKIAYRGKGPMMY